MESNPGKDSVKTGEMTTKDLEYSVNLVDEAGAGFERTDYNFERSPTMGKMLSNSIACCRGIAHEESIHAANFSVVFFEETATASPTFSTTTPISQQPPRLDLRQHRGCSFPPDGWVMDGTVCPDPEGTCVHLPKEAIRELSILGSCALLRPNMQEDSPMNNLLGLPNSLSSSYFESLDSLK